MLPAACDPHLSVPFASPPPPKLPFGMSCVFTCLVHECLWPFSKQFPRDQHQNFISYCCISELRFGRYPCSGGLLKFLVVLGSDRGLFCAGTALPGYCCSVWKLSSVCDWNFYWCVDVTTSVLKCLCQSVCIDGLFILNIGLWINRCIWFCVSNAAPGCVLAAPPASIVDARRKYCIAFW